LSQGGEAEKPEKKAEGDNQERTRIRAPGDMKPPGEVAGTEVVNMQSSDL